MVTKAPETGQASREQPLQQPEIGTQGNSHVNLFGSPRYEWSTGWRGFDLPQLIHFKSNLLDIALYCSISSMNEEQTFVDGASTTKKMVLTDNGGLILIPVISEEFVEVWAKLRRRQCRSIGELTIKSIWSPATICRIGGSQLSEVELNRIELSAGKR